MNRDEILKALEDSEALLADDFDEALIGLAQHGPASGRVALYDREKCIEILMRDGTAHEDAVEHFEFNVVGSWLGKKTPIFATLAEPRCRRAHVDDMIEQWKAHQADPNRPKSTLELMRKVVRANVTKPCTRCRADVTCDAFTLQVICVECLDEVRGRWAGKPKPEFHMPADSFEVPEARFEYAAAVADWKLANPEEDS
jgi:hypothetical protein